MNELPRTAQDRDTLQYRVGDLLIDAGPQRVTREGKVIALPKLSYDLLMALVRAAPNLLSIDALMGEVWPKLIVSPETVSQRIKLLRDALGDDPRNPRYVEGLRGRGYRLIPVVESAIAPTAATQSPDPTSAASNKISEPELQSSAAPSLPSAGPSLPPLTPSLPLLAPRRRRNWAIIVAVAFAVGALGVWKIGQRELYRPRTSVDVVAVRPRSVAVLPFESLSAEPDNEYIALGTASESHLIVPRSPKFNYGKLAQICSATGLDPVTDNIHTEIKSPRHAQQLPANAS